MEPFNNECIKTCPALVDLRVQKCVARYVIDSIETAKEALYECDAPLEEVQIADMDSVGQGVGPLRADKFIEIADRRLEHANDTMETVRVLGARACMDCEGPVTVKRFFRKPEQICGNPNLQADYSYAKRNGLLDPRLP